jgi:hypothetical protein
LLFFVAQATQNAEKKFSAARIRQVAKPCVKRFPGRLPALERGVRIKSNSNFLAHKDNKKSAPKSAFFSYLSDFQINA